MFRYNPPSGYRLPAQPYSSFGYDGNLWVPGLLGKMRSVMPGGVRGFLRQAAKRCYTNGAVASTPTDFYNVRMFNTTYETVSQVQVGFPAWYDAGAGETSITGTLTVQAYWQWAGSSVVTPLSFQGGNAVGTKSAGNVATDDMVIHSDLCNIPPGKGKFFLNYYLKNVTTGQIPFGLFNTSGAGYVAGGDAVATGANVAQNGAFADAGIAETFFLWPSYIAAIVSGHIPAYGIWGDSRCCSEGGIVLSTTGDIGEVPRGIGGAIAQGVAGGGVPYLNTSRAGASALATTINEHVQRALLLNRFCDRILFDLGTNDFVAGQTAAQVEANRAIIQGYTPGKLFYPTTVSPRTTSSDSWATAGNQTVLASEAQRTTYNNNLLATGTVTYGFIGNLKPFNEVAAGKWLTNGAANYPTNDGVHGSGAINQTISLVLPA